MLALAERSLLRHHLLLAFRKPLLERLLLPLQLVELARDLRLRLLERVLALGDRRDLLRQLGSRRRAFLVGCLQLAHLQLDELLTLRRARLGARQLLLQLTEPGLGLDELIEALRDRLLALLECRFGL